jgi:pilus assembly protein CpaC
MIPRAKQFLSAVAGFIIVILVAGPQAQQQPQFAPTGAPLLTAAPREPVEAPTDIDLLVGRSTVLNVGSAIARVSLTVPDIADALVTAPTQLLIHGKTPGTISLFVWDRGGAIKTYEVKVRRDLSALIAQFKQLFPGETITVLGSGKDVVVSGTVTSKYVIEKAAEVAGGYVEKKENVVNLLKQQEGVASNQVMLRVRFAEVSRNALQELGASFIAEARSGKWFGRSTTQEFAAPERDSDGKLVFSDFLNLFLFNTKAGLGGVVRALQSKGLFESLAEPNLIATNGKEASFLAGGEFPIPVVQSGGSGNSISVVFKEFGIRLSFTPTVLGGDLVNLKVKPEVSALDFANAVTVSGFRIPALTTRKTETEVELRDGQTFAIAGLMNNTVTSTMSKIPGIGDIPILGLLFRSKAHQKSQTELVVMITPTIIRKGQMGVSEGLPSLIEPYMGTPDKSLPNPGAYVGSPRYPVNKAAPRSGSENDAQAVEPKAVAPATRTAQPTASAPKPTVSTPAAPSAVTPSAVSKPAPKSSSTVTPPTQLSPSQPATSAAPPAAAEPKSVPLTAAERKRIDAAHVQEKKDADVLAKKHAAQAEATAVLRAIDDKRKVEEAKATLKKSEEDRRIADRIAKERAIRDAELEKKNAEAARRKADEDQKREKSLSEAAARLKEAQSAYQTEIDKAKGSPSEKAESSGKTVASSRPRQ